MDLPQGEPAIRTIAMPSDTNPAGDIFGGWLMAQMDLAAGNVAARRARGRCATIAVDGFTFLKPVHVGDEVTVYAADAERRPHLDQAQGLGLAPRRATARRASRSPRRVFTFVAIDEQAPPAAGAAGLGWVLFSKPGLEPEGGPVGKITDTKADIILALRHSQASRRQLVDRRIGPGREWER